MIDNIEDQGHQEVTMSTETQEAAELYAKYLIAEYVNSDYDHRKGRSLLAWKRNFKYQYNSLSYETGSIFRSLVSFYFEQKSKHFEAKEPVNDSEDVYNGRY